MRTAIYVYEPTTVALHAADPRDAKMQICRYNRTAQPATKTLQLDPGIYLIVSNGPVSVAAPSVEVQAVANDKDDWPRPTATVLALEPGATPDAVTQFFTVAKSL